MKLLSRPSALIPVAMSLGALATVLIYLALYGTARQADEGTAAHIWQLLMAGQVPIVAYFVLKWLPIEPLKALAVLGVQSAAAVAAVFPVWWLEW